MKWFDFNTGWIFASLGYSAKTTDGGANWFFQNTSGQYGYSCYFTHPDSGYVVGDNSYILKIMGKIITGAEWSGTQIPSGYYLKQNYPNPFNPSTTIKFSIPSSQENIMLDVHNSIGEQVMVLVDKSLPAGNYEVSFSTTNLPSGVYYYKLEAGNFNETRKMILLK
jgi:hypothetical protein